MKKSIRRKLIMSAVAVGAAALATTSSTYAWFVSNTTVKTGEVTGNVSASNANLSISATENGVYGLTATPTFKDGNSTLKPITKNESSGDFGKYVNISGGEETSGFVEFDLWFNVSGLDTTNFNYTLNIASATSADTTQADDGYHTALVDVVAAGTYTKIEKGQKYKEDVTKSMVLSYVTGDDNASSSSTTVNNPFNNAAAKYDAIAYYNAVVGSNVAKASTANFGTALNNLTSDVVIRNITADGKVKVTFQIWLDGADDACFDGVASHTWEASFDFKLVSTSKSKA